METGQSLSGETESIQIQVIEPTETETGNLFQMKLNYELNKDKYADRAIPFRQYRVVIKPTKSRQAIL